MPTLEATLPQIGRIRAGDQVATGKNGKKRPHKLTEFRLTAKTRAALDAAVEMGWATEVREWTDAPDGRQWEAYLTIDSLEVVVPPFAAFSQYDELWTGGECIYRCDGDLVLTAQHREKGFKDWPEMGTTDAPQIRAGMPCQCEAFAERVPTVTRINLLVPQLPGFGVWRLDTKSYYGGMELQGIVQMMESHAKHERFIVCDLAITERVVRREGQTRRFPVVSLQPRATPMQLLTGHIPDKAMLTAAPSTPALPMPTGTDVHGAEPEIKAATPTQGTTTGKERKALLHQLWLAAENAGVSARLRPYVARKLHLETEEHCTTDQLKKLIAHVAKYVNHAFPAPDEEAAVQQPELIDSTSEGAKRAE